MLWKAYKVTFFLLPFFFCVEIWAQASSLLKSNGFLIVRESDGKVYARGTPPVKMGESLVIVRVVPELDEFEVIAEGQLVQILKDGFALKINSNSIQKYPQPKDYVLQLGNPKSFELIVEDAPVKKAVLDPQVPEAPEPGYIELGWGYYLGSLSSETETQANQYKQFNNYKFSGFRLEWFLDFVSNYGLLLETTSGGIPVKSYFHEDIVSKYSKTNLRIMYRTKKMPGERWRNTFYLDNFIEKFSTENKDEYVLSSNYSGVGLGWNLKYEPGDLLLVSNKTKYQFESAWFGLTYYPMVNAQDVLVSRGTSSGGSFKYVFEAGAAETFYLTWVPWVKRYTAKISYQYSQTQLKFSGPTKSEQGGVYIIPEGRTYHEKDQVVMLTIGVRFEDVIGQIFKPRN